MSEDLNLALTFDDVALEPYYSNLSSRTEPSLKTELAKDVWIDTPLLASNMESVISDELADVFLSFGGMPIFHRFTEDENKIINWANKYGDKCFISWGVQNLNNLFRILDSCERLPKGVCFDIANGHTIQQASAVEDIKKRFPTLKLIGGNICGKTATYDMCNWGLDAARVGVGCGSACTTRIVTGFGIPQFTALRNCAYVAKQRGLPLIADGGNRNSRDIILALAAGASTVMIGGMFAATDESAALKDSDRFGRKIARYRGQASEAFQRPGLAPEGVEGWVEVSGSAKGLIEKLHSQIKSGLSYGGARTIEELQKHAKFVRTTPSYHTESKARI